MPTDVTVTVSSASRTASNMVEKRTATVLGSHVKLWAGDLRRRPQSDLASVGGEQAVFFPLLQFFPHSHFLG